MVSPMKRCAIICFVKTPGLSKPKTRLAASIGEEKALQIYLRLVQCMSETFDLLKGESLDLIWAVNESNGGGHYLWEGREIWTQPEGTLGEKLFAMEERASKTYQNWIFVGSDTPALDALLILKAVKFLRDNDFVTGPSLDGGFYLWGSRKKLEKQRWLSTPYSTSETLRFLTQDLENIKYLETLPDLDHVEDIEKVKKSMSLMSQSRHQLLQLFETYISKK